MAWCTACNTAKPTTAFEAHPRKRNGLSSWCKHCAQEQTKEWRARNRETLKGRRRAKYEANPEIERQRVKQSATYQAARANHPFETRHCVGCLVEFTSNIPRRKYCDPSCFWRSRRQTYPRPSKALRQRILARDNWHCYLCSRPIDPAIVWPKALAPSVDHIKPVTAGGTNAEGNLRASHWACNQDKGDRLISELWVGA
jgi:5-methylcytosine-specific restriction endonuclease McrA